MKKLKFLYLLLILVFLKSDFVYATCLDSSIECRTNNTSEYNILSYSEAYSCAQSWASCLVSAAESPNAYSRTWQVNYLTRKISFVIQDGYYSNGYYLTYGSSIDEDGDGIPTPYDTDPDTPIPFTVDSTGAAVYPDSDGDGTTDNQDLYPYDATPYKWKIFLYYIDDLGKNRPTAIVTDRDSDGDGLPDIFYVGELPEGETEIMHLTQIYKDSDTLIDELTLSYTQEDVDAMTFPRSDGSSLKHEDQTANVPTSGSSPDTDNLPSVQPGVESTGTETDGEIQGKINDNIVQGNKNQIKMEGHLKDISLTLAKINRKSGMGAIVAMSPGTESGSEEGLTKEDLEEYTETYDNSTTDGLVVGDKVVVYQGIGTKFTTRYTEFTTAIKGTDLFSIPFSFFNNLPTGGSSVKTVDIGHWGGTSMNVFNFDLADYDSVWEVLKVIILILTGYQSIKIVILKHA